MSERLFPDSVYAPLKGETKGAMETRLWLPQRVGRFFCAPRCGCRCTWKDFQLATKRAAALCKLLGPGWEPRVWENGMWHYEATKGLAEVHANHSIDGDASYSVWLQSEVSSLGGSVNASMQVIVDVPVKRDGTSDIRATLKKALNMKRAAANTLLEEAEKVMT